MVSKKDLETFCNQLSERVYRLEHNGLDQKIKACTDRVDIIHTRVNAADQRTSPSQNVPNQKHVVTGLYIGWGSGKRYFSIHGEWTSSWDHAMVFEDRTSALTIEMMLKERDANTPIKIGVETYPKNQIRKHDMTNQANQIKRLQKEVELLREENRRLRIHGVPEAMHATDAVNDAVDNDEPNE